MNTLKSGTVIVVLLGVLYGVYIVLSKPERRLSDSPLSATAEIGNPLQIEFGGPPTREPQLAVEPAASSGPASVGDSPASLASPVAITTPAAGNSPYAPPPGYGEATSAPASSANSPSAYGGSPSAYAPTPPAAGYAGSYQAPSAEAYAASPTAVQPVSAIGELNSSPPSAYGSAATGRNPALTEYTLRQVWHQAEQLVSANKLREALALLSPYYTSPDLTAEQREALVQWLDPLAARVIYSKQHLLEAPYETRAKETLFSIEERFHVPWQLLQNINHDVVSDPQILVVGTLLKVVPGPFRAEIDLSRQELTLFLKDMYAGRFAFSLGNEPPQPGQYRVGDKRRDRVYYGPNVTIPASDPKNPYGGYWLEIGSNVHIHGSPQQPSSAETLGCISLSPQDAKDVYSILSLGSDVVIR